MRLGRQHTAQSSVNVCRRLPLGSTNTSFSSPQNAHVYDTSLSLRRWRDVPHVFGLPTLTMDDRCLVGPLPGVAGLGPWVPTRRRRSTSAKSPARFAGRDVDETERRERCRRAYATHGCAGPSRPPPRETILDGVSIRTHSLAATSGVGS